MKSIEEKRREQSLYRLVDGDKESGAGRIGDRDGTTLSDLALQDLIRRTGVEIDFRYKLESIDLWETRYFHLLDGEDAVFRWSMGTGLRPFASALDEPLRAEFLEQCRRLLGAAYPMRPNGKTIHRFLRLFLVAIVQ